MTTATMVDKAMDPAHIETASSNNHDDDSKSAVVATATQAEHDLTLADLLRNHKLVVWWCFFWAMAAVGWLVLTDTDHKLVASN
jgi:hypothetical protein